MPIFILWPSAIILFILFAAGLFTLMAQKKRLIKKVSFGLFVFSSATGFLVYSFSHFPLEAGFVDVPVAVLRGILDTMRMYSLNTNYRALVDALRVEHLNEIPWLYIIFWLAHISAMIVVQVALIALFGKKFTDYFRLRWGRHNEVYIVKGSDKCALILGENIATDDNPSGPPNTDKLVVFLIEGDADAKNIYEKASHFGALVLTLDKAHDLLYYAEKAGLGTNNRKKYHLILTGNGMSAPEDAQRIAVFAKEKSAAPECLSIFVITSSDWDRDQIEEITQAKCGDGRPYPYTFHIVNELDLLIRQMVAKHPPFQCPGLHFSNGVAARGFTAMILGFGRVGQTALLRLIMNGQFAKSRMRAIIVDKNIEATRDCFLHRYPSLNLCCEMEFKSCDVQCNGFFALLRETEGIDYVVSALCDNELNKRTAQDVKLHYERTNKDAMPFIAVSEKSGCMHDEKFNKKMFIFGCREEIYKSSVIIRKENDRMAKAVHKTYGGNPPWHELEWFFQESSRASADFIPAMLYLAGSPKDIESEDALTKDSALAETLSQTEHLRWNAFHAAMGYRKISIDEMKQRYHESNRLDLARRDTNARLHACLIPWDELDKLSETYNALVRKHNQSAPVGNQERERDFQDDDRKIITSIPKFLREAKGL